MPIACRSPEAESSGREDGPARNTTRGSPPASPRTFLRNEANSPDPSMGKPFGRDLSGIPRAFPRTGSWVRPAPRAGSVPHRDLGPFVRGREPPSRPRTRPRTFLQNEANSPDPTMTKTLGSDPSGNSRTSPRAASWGRSVAGMASSRRDGRPDGATGPGVGVGRALSRCLLMGDDPRDGRGQASVRMQAGPDSPPDIIAPGRPGLSHSSPPDGRKSGSGSV